LIQVDLLGKEKEIVKTKIMFICLSILLFGCSENLIVNEVVEDNAIEEIIEENVEEEITEEEVIIVEESIHDYVEVLENQMRPLGEILYSSERGGDRDLYLLNIRTGREHLLLDLPSQEGHGDFSPDGYKIVFFSTMDDNRELYTIDLRESPLNPIRLTHNNGQDHLPDWSPDGHYIVFESTRDGNSEIYIMNSDGSNERRLTKNSVKDKQPKFSPDGKKIMYTTWYSGIQHAAVIHMADILSSDAMPEPETIDVKSVGYVDFHPNENKIIYHGNLKGKYHIFTMDLDTLETELLSEYSTYNNFVPVYSPDGHWYSFNTEKSFGTGDVWIKHVTEDIEIQLTIDPSSDWGPDFRPRPSMNKFVYDSNIEGDREIFLLEHGQHIKLTDNTSKDGIPYWSPDGEKIVFFSNRDGDDEIYVMNSDGSDPIQLTDNDKEDRAAVFSNDGSYIAFSSKRDGDREIFIMSSDGKYQTQVTFNEQADFWPSFSKDDQYLTYTYFGESQDTYRLDFKAWLQDPSTKPELFKENCSRIEYSPDNHRIAYSTKINGSWDIAVCDADGSNEVLMTFGGGDEWVPTWMDDDHIIFSRESGYKAYLILMNIHTLEESILRENDAQNWRPVYSPYY